MESQIHNRMSDIFDTKNQDPGLFFLFRNSEKEVIFSDKKFE